MKFLAMCIIALVVLPVIWLLNKGADKAINKFGTSQMKETWNEDSPKQQRQELGKAWLIFLVIVVVVVLFAMCNA